MESKTLDFTGLKIPRDYKKKKEGSRKKDKSKKKSHK